MTAERALRAGQQIGSYTILSPLGAGGMGEVYRAHDAALGREVAIKVLPPVFSNDPERLVRFEREARVLASLNHPNIATIHGIERTSPSPSGIHALVLEVVEGETLEERLARLTGPSKSGVGGALSLTEAVNIARQVADAVDAAHEKGIVHRDLKPANIKIRPDGVVKVLDFGLAKGAEAPDAGVPGSNISHSPTMIAGTREGVLLGTAAYMSPEQASGMAADRRSDIWAFGVVLYEMVAGRRPFQGESTPELLRAILTADPPLDAVPQPLRLVVARCLEKDPRHRWQSMADVRLLLEDGMSPVPASMAVARPNRLPWIVAGVLAVALALALVPASRRPSSAAPPGEPTAVFSLPIPGGDAPSSYFEVSPDGKSVAITAVVNGRRNLYVRRIDSLQATLIPDTDDATSPFWSPDGTHIAFVSGGTLKRVPTIGGRVVPLLAGVAAQGGSWNEAGKILIASPEGMRAVDEDSGAAVLAMKLPGATHPHFLPDGQRFLYTLADPTAAHLDGIYVGSITGAAPFRILEERSKAQYVRPAAGTGPGHLLYRRAGRLMAQPFDADRAELMGDAVPVTNEDVISINAYGPTVLFSSSQTGLLAYQPRVLEQLLWVDQKGAVLEPVGPPGEYRNFRLSHDGTRIAMDVNIFGNGSSSADVATMDLRRGVSERLTFDGEADLVPVWSPDDEQIAFTSRRTGSFQPFITTGPNEEKPLATMGPGGGWPVDWSPDGMYVLWQGNGLWAVPASGSSKLQQYVDNQFAPRYARFSPDGRWVAYSSRESGREEVYVQAFPRGRRMPVSGSGGSAPAWGKEGRDLYYVSAEGSLTVVSVKPSGETLEFGRPQSLFVARPSNFSRDYEVSADGKRFLIARPAHPAAAAMTVLLNWRALLSIR